MSKIVIGILFSAIALIIVGLILEISVFTRGSGVVIVVGLAYAYVVSKRDAALISYALEERLAENEKKQAAKPAVAPAEPFKMSDSRTRAV